MEFEHIGSHCSLDGCNQRDFLPYICDICKNKFCHEHRSYIAHHCNNISIKDKTSIDCPLCNKSILLTKADDPNIIWEQHYTKLCKPNNNNNNNNNNKSKKKCARDGCRAELSISNTMTCSKCNKCVCLTHRIPEEHSCTSLRNNNNNNNSNKINEKRIAAMSNNNNNNNKLNKFQGNKDMSVYATADKRIKKNDSNSNNSNSNNSNISNSDCNNQYMCHLCSETFIDPILLVNHIDQYHTNNNNNNNRNKQKTEICPQCNKQFYDVNELVTHFENTHNNNNNNINNNNNKKNSSEKCILS